MEQEEGPRAAQAAPLVYITPRLLAKQLDGESIRNATRLNLCGKSFPRGEIEVSANQCVRCGGPCFVPFLILLLVPPSLPHTSSVSP